MSLFNKIYTTSVLPADGTLPTAGQVLVSSDTSGTLGYASVPVSGGSASFSDITLTNALDQILMGANLTLSSSVSTNGTIYTLPEVGADSFFVMSEGDQGINGNKTFNENVVVSGNLTVSGTTTAVNTTNLEVKDNIIVLNNGETSGAITAGTAGLRIERSAAGTADVLMVYDDTVDKWMTSVDNGTTKTAVAEIATGDGQTTDYLTAFDSAGRLVSSVVKTDVAKLSSAQTFTAVNTFLQSKKTIQTTVVAAATVDATYASFIPCSTAGGAFTITLPAVSGFEGSTYTFYLGAYGGDLTIAPNGAELIDGLSSVVMKYAGVKVNIFAVAGGWVIV